MNRYLFVKRLFDIVSSFIAITLLIIPWLIIAVIIKIQSPGPIIFKANRVGLNGEVFTLYKFRSMNVDSGIIHATTLRGDSRIYPFGEFLRKSKIDETPQLINVLMGEMSIIGPRPEDEINSNLYYTGEYKRIVTVKPGLSSPASLYDYTHGELIDNEQDYVDSFLPKKLDVELYYIDHRNAIYDLTIVLRTIVTIVLVMAGKDDIKEPREVIICEREKTKRSY